VVGINAIAAAARRHHPTTTFSLQAFTQTTGLDPSDR